MGIGTWALLLYRLVSDFLKKCDDDHVAAFGAMSAFFILLSFFPFMIFLLTLTRFAPITKEHIINVLVNVMSFESESMIRSVVNEVYRKTGASVFTFSIISALWSSSKGFFSIIKGLNSVYDLDDNRNFIVLRLFSTIYTIVFAFLIVAMLIMWVFGKILYQKILVSYPMLASIAEFIWHKRIIMSVIVLTVFFMGLYWILPDRKSSFLRQWPGALVAAIGWIVVSVVCSLFMGGFTSFSYVYGSMAGIMIVLLWLYFCMSMVFYGAEFNYLLENKEDYHILVWAFRHSRLVTKRRKEELKRKRKEKREGS